MSRPIDMGDMYGLEITPLHKELNKVLLEQGEFYFQKNQLLDSFGLAYTREDTAKAIDLLITFTKFLKTNRTQLRNMGFVMVDKEQGIVAFTYTVESTRYNNQPIWVKEQFKLEVPLLALLNETAKLWIKAYHARPQAEILKVINGK